MINLIVAVDQNYMIGKNGLIPWKNKEDMKFFKKITMNNPLIMGRKTYESLPFVLPDRPHFVVTKNQKFIHVSFKKKESVFCCDSIVSAVSKSAIFNVKNSNCLINIFVIGGESIYNKFMNIDIVDRVIISKMNMAVEQNDSSKYFCFEKWENNFVLLKTKLFKDFVLEIWDRKLRIEL